MIYFVCGVIFGVIGYALIRRIFRAHGTLRIDHSDPEKDVYRIEIDNLEQLNGKTRVELKIDHHADLSQD